MAGFRVAIIGPDGVGKSTLVTAIAAGAGVPTRTLYLGLYGSHRSRIRLPGVAFGQRLLQRRRAAVIGRWHRARGRLVLHDRFPSDALVDLPSEGQRGRRLRRRLLASGHDRADLVILLDAPAELVASRSGGSPVQAEERRRAYLALTRVLPDLVVADATRPPGELRDWAIGEISRRWTQRGTT
jgi:thymidylate kinase